MLHIYSFYDDFLLYYNLFANLFVQQFIEMNIIAIHIFFISEVMMFKDDVVAIAKMKITFCGDICTWVTGKYLSIFPQTILTKCFLEALRILPQIISQNLFIRTSVIFHRMFSV